jgi:hypothetical protein
MSIHVYTSPSGSRRRVMAIVVMMSGLAACGSTPRPTDSEATNQPAAMSQAIDLPPVVDHFQRMNVLRRNDGNDVTAGYEFGNDADMVIATVRVRTALSDENLIPLLNDNRSADSAASAEPLQKAVMQVRHFYPGADLRDVRPVYLVKHGVLQGGRAATLRYEDVLAGQRQKIDLDIYMFCCVDGQKAYEFRIRHAADNDVQRLAVSFMQALSWSPAADPAGER